MGFGAVHWLPCFMKCVFSSKNVFNFEGYFKCGFQFSHTFWEMDHVAKMVLGPGWQECALNRQMKKKKRRHL